MTSEKKKKTVIKKKKKGSNIPQNKEGFADVMLEVESQSHSQKEATLHAVNEFLRSARLDPGFSVLLDAES